MAPAIQIGRMEVPLEIEAKYNEYYDGPYGQTHRWCKELTAELTGKGRPPKRMLYWYTTCPKCSKAYGHNPIVLFAEC